MLSFLYFHTGQQDLVCCEAGQGKRANTAYANSNGSGNAKGAGHVH